MTTEGPPALPGSDIDLQDAGVVANLFHRAAEANLHEPLRHGACVELPRQGHLLMSGDLHDHLFNFMKILKLAALHRSPQRHVILHELIHGPSTVNGADLSVRLLARAAAVKLAYPNQVHFLQANHDLAQLGGEGIAKNGKSVTRAFDDGIDFIFGNGGEAVRAAVHTFIRSSPLAVRCANGVFCSHSLPPARMMPTFDTTVLDRVPTEADLLAGGAGFEMVWGRRHPQEVADRLAAVWNVRVFVMGHQTVEMGYEEQANTMLIIASNHDHGMALPIDLAKEYDRDALVRALVPLAGVVL